MNDRKIAFIICANNSLYYEECVWYINQLYVPDNMEIDILCITEAEGMTQGYNAAIESTDAKYKVYLHQDVFIYNKNFIIEILKIFGTDEKIGMIGVIGGVGLPQNAVIWNAWNVGSTYGCNSKAAFALNWYQGKFEIPVEVEAIDGMLMATQYDIKWREDLELGWDFYDVSQSLEFRRRGFKVVIPYQEKPWCLHDCGPSKLLNYDKTREKILTEYQDFFMDSYQPMDISEMCQLEESIFEKIKTYMENGDFELAIQMKEMIDYSIISNNSLIYALNMLEIYQEEKKSDIKESIFFDDMQNWENWKDKYDSVKFGIRHIIASTNSIQMEALMEMINCGQISKQAIIVIARHSSIAPYAGR